MITKMEFPNQRRYETTLAGRKLVVETGKLAGLSNGSCMVRLGRYLCAGQRHRFQKAP